ncbi:secondary thiamine-phosphate synthase enzyme YjbQ [Azorhizobium doebereinerae]|uniref:secondary thiamine-phosphate synthase enzyme YjbQ n=1 Tax=Azorhizobium doebereinerae TaxID=281091 RepID=UPI0004015887|nr:secondary thiamine-phosphate synthase enzyme YjbQ [Azorhizobium doebereinerae]
MKRSPAVRVPLEIQAQSLLEVETRGQGFTDLTREAAAFLAEIGAEQGLLTVFCRHTSASLTIQENADPDVQRDLLTALDDLAPRDRGWVHDTEGPDDMPAHVRTLLSDTALAIPVADGGARLGTWQGLYLVEHRDRPHRRQVVLGFLGTARGS